MGILFSLCQKKPPLVLMLGSECEIKRKVLQRNFESFIGEIKGKEEYEELDIFVEGPLKFKLLDLGPDQLEDKYVSSINSADVIIFMTTPGYEQFDIGWIESFKDNNQYATKPILFLIHKDSDISFQEDVLPPLWRVIVTKYDNEEQTEKAFQWVNTTIKAAKNKIKIPFSLPLVKFK